MTKPEEILHDFIQEFKDACPDMWEVSRYLRKRRGCPSAELFERARRKIDGALAKALKKYMELNNEE